MTAPDFVPPRAVGWFVKRNKVAFPAASNLELVGGTPSLVQAVAPDPAQLTLVGKVPTIRNEELKTISYNFTSGKPVGMLEDGTDPDLLPHIIVGGNRLIERNPGGADNGFFSVALYPEVMGTNTHRSTVTVGSSSSGTNRGVMAVVGGNDGAGGDGVTNCVAFRVRGQGGLPGAIFSKVGGVWTGEVSSDNTLASPNDTIGLEISEDHGIYTYTGYRNGVPVPGAVWTDATAKIGVPGRAWGGGFYCLVSGGGYFPSLGIFQYDGIDL